MNDTVHIGVHMKDFPASPILRGKIKGFPGQISDTISYDARTPIVGGLVQHKYALLSRLTQETAGREVIRILLTNPPEVTEDIYYNEYQENLQAALDREVIVRVLLLDLSQDSIRGTFEDNWEFIKSTPLYNHDYADIKRGALESFKVLSDNSAAFFHANSFEIFGRNKFRLEKLANNFPVSLGNFDDPVMAQSLIEIFDRAYSVAIPQ